MVIRQKLLGGEDEIRTLNIEREKKTSNIEHRTPNIERRTPNFQRRTVEKRKSGQTFFSLDRIHEGLRLQSKMARTMTELFSTV